MKSARTLLLILVSISYIIVIGGATYEHLSVVPQWSAAPPASLTMFQGEYGLRGGNFWPPMHMLTLTLFAITLALNWKTARRRFILMALAGYGLVIAVTAVYFLPELVAITNTPYQAIVDAGLTARAGTWKSLSIIRLAVMLVAAGVLLFALTKPGEGRDALEARLGAQPD